MSLITTNPPPQEEEPPIASGVFWPAIDPADIREAQRIDSTVTPPRLKLALIEAIATANDELRAWRMARIAEGYAALADVPCDDEVDDVTVLVQRYQRAVGCLAKALLQERYRDFDSTARGDKQADALEPAIEDARRDYRWAISDILGVGRCTVELI